MHRDLSLVTIIQLMKNCVSPIAVALTALSISGIGSLQGAIAQQQPTILQEQATKRNHLIPVKNVSPSIMAWWLDPVHNTEPVQFQNSRTAAEGVLPPSEKDPGKPLGDYKLPDGIDRLVAVDPQNSLLVFGTATGISQLEKVVASLDKPLRQIEVEVQYLQISDAELKKLGSKNFIPTSPKDPTSWAILTSDSELKHIQDSAHLGFIRSSTIATFVEKTKARLITAPRVTAFDNQAASLRSETSRPFILASETAIPTYTEPDAQCLLYWSSRLGITVRPTINNDGTISMALAPGLTIQLQVQAKEASKARSIAHFDRNPYTQVQTKEDLKATPQALNGVETVWQRQLGGIVNLPNIKSGQTLAVMGLNSDSLLPRDPADKSKPTDVLLLVTAQIVRRAGT
jgi:type II secretory pathway component GspD/PulD (secretin)